PEAGIRQRLRLNASRNIGFSEIVSARAPARCSLERSTERSSARASGTEGRGDHAPARPGSERPGGVHGAGAGGAIRADRSFQLLFEPRIRVVSDLTDCSAFAGPLH